MSPDPRLIEQLAGAGVDRCVLLLPSAPRDVVVSVLDALDSDLVALATAR